jgi:hypothetical protein
LNPSYRPVAIAETFHGFTRFQIMKFRHGISNWAATVLFQTLTGALAENRICR